MAFFSDLLKKWFYTNDSSAAASNARIPLLTATGEPKGSDTMANIASVLSGTRSSTLSAGADLNNVNLGFGVLAVGTGSTMASLLHTPTGVGSYAGVVINLAGSGTGWIFQIISTQKPAIYVRHIHTDSANNTPWKEL